MRITNNMLINNIMTHLSSNLNRTMKYQNQLATGKKISMPSDDPIVASRALKLRTDVAEIQQYSRNMDDALSWMAITEATMNQINDVLQRFREITVQAANGTNTPDDLQKIGAEAGELVTQIIQLANTTYAGRYIFSGFKTDKPLLNSDGTFNVGFMENEYIQFEIGIGDFINVNVPGYDLFHRSNVASQGDVSSLFQTLDSIKKAINGQDLDPDENQHEKISNLLGELDLEIENLLRVRAGLGARMNRVELTGNRLDDDYVNFTKLMSLNEDVDMAEAIMNLFNEQNVYQASLSTTARVIQPSLVDYLK
ncbi:MAG TPA: flagellar hook-associated protein FlgL [Thermoclostridium caenicola]|uniref:flagellar hook-associated protein FlgL n=1 Tax=Thermoclostridium caenicola TaxID=659425 RepID=UPI002CA13DF4|nr:flagellar hook-associated protein FlgL [Thermoclostridium caenicola]HPO77233.1 flagellar hook-associated protein FlgL [Thermoclostridium caenicola]